MFFDGLYQGKYILVESETLEEYRLNDSTFDIDIEYNKESNIIVENELIKGWVRVVKQDLENSNVRLQGVEFELYDEDMNLLETLVTDEKGEAISQKYPSVNKKYYLKEIKTIDGYVLDTELKEITLVNDTILDIFVKNAKTPKETKTIIIENEPDPIYEKVLIGEPKIIRKVVKLPKTGM